MELVKAIAELFSDIVAFLTFLWAFYLWTKQTEQSKVAAIFFMAMSAAIAAS